MSEFSTMCIQGRLTENDKNCFRLPIYESNTYKKKYYTRSYTPNRDLLEKTFCNLYTTPNKTISECSAVSSGIAAFAILLNNDRILPYGNNNTILVDIEMYDEIKKLFQFFKYIYNIKYVDMANLDDIKKEMNNTVRMVFVDSCPFPYFHRQDIKAIADIVHYHNEVAQLIIDNSNLSCYNYNPFKDDADIVVESLGKYCCGHGDAMGGVILNENVEYAVTLFGNGIDSFSAWLISRGMSTMEIRMKRCMETAQIIYNYLKDNIKIDNIYKCAGVITFELPGNRSFKQIEEVMSKLSIIKREYSFGQDNTCWMIENITNKNHIRLAIGLEDPEDLIADIDRALLYK